MRQMYTKVDTIGLMVIINGLKASIKTNLGLEVEPLAAA